MDTDGFLRFVDQKFGFEMEENGTYEGFDRYVAKNDGGILGINDDVAVVGTSQALFEDAIAAGNGDGSRFLAANEDALEVADAVDDPDHLTLFGVVEADSPEPRRATANAYKFAEDRSRFFDIIVYRSESLAEENESDERDWYNEDALEDFSSRVDGRTVILSWLEPNAEID